MSSPHWRTIAAGLNGALAVALAAYGAHGLSPDLPGKLHNAYATASQIHLAHTAALAALAFQHRFGAAFGLMLAGIAGFSGALYAFALTADKSFAIVAPLGGAVLIAAWLALAIEGWRKV